jgi:hypothetical protein
VLAKLDRVAVAKYCRLSDGWGTVLVSRMMEKHRQTSCLRITIFRGPYEHQETVPNETAHYLSFDSVHSSISVEKEPTDVGSSHIVLLLSSAPTEGPIPHGTMILIKHT